MIRSLGDNFLFYTMGMIIGLPHKVLLRADCTYIQSAGHILSTLYLVLLFEGFSRVI